MQAALDVHRAGARGAEVVGHERSGVRRELVGGERGHEHEIHVLGGHASLLQRGAAAVVARSWRRSPSAT